MEEKIINIPFMEYNSWDELPQDYRELLYSAAKACKSSYAPYSNFHVGAAVRMGNGKIVTGSNQENAASPSGLCAERVALFTAHHMYPEEKVVAIAIVGSQNGIVTGEFTYPCAACVQVMVESEKRSGSPMAIIVGSATKVRAIGSVNGLLPFSFSNIPAE